MAAQRNGLCSVPGSAVILGSHWAGAVLIFLLTFTRSPQSLAILKSWMHCGLGY